MCTLSVTPLAQGGAIVAMNRDERRERPLGGGLVRAQREGVTLLYPRDVLGGGSWFVLSERGLVVTLLNVWGAADPAPGGPSRGLLPLRFGVLPSLEAVHEALLAFDPWPYAGFRVVAAQLGRPLVEAVWDRRRLRVQRVPWGRHIAVSSGRFESVVRPWRQRLLDAAPPTLEGVRSVHFAHDGSHGPMGFAMERVEARSVSYTEAVLGPKMELRFIEEPPQGLDAGKRRRLEASVRRLGGVTDFP